MGLKTNKIFKSVSMAMLVGGLAFHTLGCTPPANPPYSPPATEDPNAPESNWADYSEFSTNPVEATEQINDDYFMSALNKKYQQFYMETESIFSDQNYISKPLIIQVDSTMTGNYLKGVEELRDYYNELFEAANMHTRFEIQKVNSFDGNADIAITASTNIESQYLGTTNYGIRWGDNRSLVSTIQINAVHYKYINTTTVQYLSYKRTLNHELQHALGIGHNNVDLLSLMGSDTLHSYKNIWMLSHNDIKCFMVEKGNVIGQSAAVQKKAYDYVEEQAHNFYSGLDETILNLTQRTSIMDNTIVYYYFDFTDNPSVTAYKSVSIDLNNLYKGQYSATIVDSTGNESAFTGKAYITTEYNSSEKENFSAANQIIWLDGFMTPNGTIIPASIFGNNRSIQFQMGDKFLKFSYARGLEGGSYKTKEERDAAINANNVNTSAILPDKIKITLKKDNSQENDDEMTA